MKIKILNDVFNISKRIKDIDRNYFIVYNTLNQRFEVHNSAQLGSSYCLTLPRKNLCEDVLKYVRKTQCVNIDEILEKLENDNSMRESAKRNSAFSNIIDVVENLEK